MTGIFEPLYPTKPTPPSLREVISSMLTDLGCRSTLKGFTCLTLAIELVIEKPLLITGVVKNVYTTVAAELSTTAACVERNCRTLISALWDEQTTTVLEKYFECRTKGSKSVPTTKEFISVIRDRFLLDYYEI